MRKEGLRRNGRLAGFEVQYLAAFTGYSPQACVALAPRWCADRSPLPRDATPGRRTAARVFSYACYPRGGLRSAPCSLSRFIFLHSLCLQFGDTREARITGTR